MSPLPRPPPEADPELRDGLPEEEGEEEAIF